MNASHDGSGPGPRRPGIPLRVVEAAVALLFVCAAALVIVDSLRLGIDWADDGPRAGYFPFYVGLLMGAAALWNLGVALSGLGREGRAMRGKIFAGATELAPVASMLLPSAVFVALIWWLGIYVAAFAFLAWFMRARGGFGWLPVVAVAVGLPAALFAMFEVWFLIPLPKGPVERLLGY